MAVDLPAPFTPKTPIFAPGKKESVIPLKSSFPPGKTLLKFCITNTYHKRKNGKVRIISYIDGPFVADSNLSKKEAQEDLRNRIYNQMVERSKSSDFEKIKYIKE